MKSRPANITAFVAIIESSLLRRIFINERSMFLYSLIFEVFAINRQKPRKSNPQQENQMVGHLLGVEFNLAAEPMMVRDEIE